MVYYLNKSLLHRPLTRQIQGTQLARVQNLTLTISDRAAAMKPSASIAAKKIVSDLQASGHEIIDLTIGEPDIATPRSEEHTSELQSLMRISYAVFCLKKKNNNKKQTHHKNQTTTK